MRLKSCYFMDVANQSELTVNSAIEIDIKGSQ